MIFQAPNSILIFQALKRAAHAALGRPNFVNEEERAYIRLATMGFAPAGIIDVGAYEGNWARLARRVFPGVPILMVEPQKSKQPVLEATCAELGNVDYIQALLGAKSDEIVTFYEMETGSSILSENSNVARTEAKLTTRRLDEISANLHGPIFLKIDVQGAELQVLSGATETLNSVEIVQLEVAMLEYNKGAPTFIETIKYMDDCGFVPLDFSGFTRPNGRDLVQCDILFAKRDSAFRPKFFEF